MLRMGDLKSCWWIAGYILMLSASSVNGVTNPLDVFAINSLYAALGSPTIPGWVQIGGDPCTDAWKGVLCVNSNITGISLNAANLGGELGTNLDSFRSIISIELSNNHIGGTLPSNLPPTMKTFLLSGNQFTGSLPNGISMLSQLTDISLSNNNLTGQIPDIFQLLTGLINFDLSVNNLSGLLPPSMSNLSSLTTLHLQENKLTGTLNVIQDLPLIDLNIENNDFSGPIPPKLLTVPTFRSKGNPFNTTVLPSSPAGAPAPGPNTSLPVKPSPRETPDQQQPTGPSRSEPINTKDLTKSKHTANKTIIWSAIIVVFMLAAIGLVFFFCLSRHCKKTRGGETLVLGNEKSGSESLPQTYKQTASKGAYTKSSDAGKVDFTNVINAVGPTTSSTRSKDDHAIDIIGAVSQPPPPPPPMQYSTTKNMIKPLGVKFFTVALLQEYTNSFSQENRIGEGMLGSVYRAELPDTKIVAVKKLSSVISRQLGDEEFVELVSALAKLQHDNIVKLVGYCAEYGQRLLIYEYCSNGTLFEALHYDDEIHNKLSWNARIKIALGAARALEYLHEVCQPPIIHKNFKAINILLDEHLTPQISDCGLAPLYSDGLRNQLAQLSSSGYGAPELELGIYTYQSDVFSFGVVMLELLTGRKSFDRTRPRGDQSLVTWAIPRLHDIDSLSKMVDPSLDGAYPSKSLSRFADIISLCLQSEPEFRPPMSEIVQRLLSMQQAQNEH
ncbi:hypothetical protein V2J09_018894 [Rumex salicifolius]